MTLSKRDARLRSVALHSIASAVVRLEGPSSENVAWQDAWKATLYDYPGVALRRIKAAKAHLAKAEAALRKWAGRHP